MKNLFLLTTLLLSTSAFANYPCTYKDANGETQKMKVEFFDHLNFAKLDFPGATPSRYFVRIDRTEEELQVYQQIGTVESQKFPKLKEDKSSLFKTFYALEEGTKVTSFEWQLGKNTFKINCK